MMWEFSYSMFLEGYVFIKKVVFRFPLFFEVTFHAIVQFWFILRLGMDKVLLVFDMFSKDSFEEWNVMVEFIKSPFVEFMKRMYWKVWLESILKQGCSVEMVGWEKFTNKSYGLEGYILCFEMFRDAFTVVDILYAPERGGVKVAMK